MEHIFINQSVILFLKNNAILVEFTKFEILATDVERKLLSR